MRRGFISRLVAAACLLTGLTGPRTADGQLHIRAGSRTERPVARAAEMALRAAGYVVIDTRDEDETGRTTGQRFGISKGVPVTLQATLAWYYEPGSRPLERSYFMQVLVSALVQGSASAAPTEADSAMVHELANQVCSNWFRPEYEYRPGRDPSRPSITGKCDSKRDR